LADALILASCGGAELWSKTQERYFEMETQKRPFLSIVSAVIRNKLEELVAESRPSRWQETLAILSTYGQSEEFPSLCIALGDRLESVGDFKNASLCYMCSLSLDKAATHWRSQLEAKNKAKGKLDLMALHDFVVKVTVFMKAVDSSVILSEDNALIFTQYANALAEQGLLVTAAKYCRGSSLESKILRDRLYRSRESPGCLSALGSAPEFPFSLVQVKTAPAGATAVQRRQQPQSYTNQNQTLQHAASQSHSAYGTQQQAQSSASTPAQTLPAGWVALQDPSSGRTYYANQTTGQSSWEIPQPVAAAPAPVQNAAKPGHAAMNGSDQQTIATQPQAQAQQQIAQQPAASMNGASNPGSRSATPSRLAKKYGDGFVTSSSHPELGQQYGNVGTSNPYPGERHGIAQVAQIEKPPVSGTFDPNATPELLAEHEHIKVTLLDLSASLNACQLTPSDKRHLSEAEKGIAVLLKRLARGDLDAEVSGKVDNMVTCIRSRDYATAMAVQIGLVNSDWKDHKDWLKGMKLLIQLATKKIH
jgi:protein transport protein SEC31